VVANQPPESDRPAEELDDVVDRDEIRRRYYGLMQELRVLLPGVQILVAFLLTAPFNSRFRDLDLVGRSLYGVAMGSGTLAIVVFVAPTAIHRVGHRRYRSARLVWSIRLMRIGLAFFGLSLSSALAVVTRLVFGKPESVVVGAVSLFVVVVVWVVIPQLAGTDRDRTDRRSRSG
jgi:hypothetical protein